MTKEQIQVIKEEALSYGPDISLTSRGAFNIRAILDIVAQLDAQSEIINKLDAAIKKLHHSRSMPG